MTGIDIIKASAGSGKTWTLTREFIRFLVPADDAPFDERAFRHILAVTFTNKATEEMKSRIIKELHALATNPDYDYPEPGTRATPLIKKRAAMALTAILHDYASFSVSTIDRFFQVVMRAFAREINQYASYKVELDRDSVLQQAVDRMLASLDEPGNEMLLRWLTDYSLEQVRSGQQWDISKKLFEFSKLFMTDAFKLKRRTLGPDLWSKERITAFREMLQAMIEEAQKPDSTISAEDAKTAEILDKNVHLLGIFSDLYAHLSACLKENNLVLLSETSDVLSRIIDGSDTPFIYEKVGTRYDHFMLDEFQDTSRLQWENFRPLLREAADRGEGSLIVGDIKQSIYRWRDSDMNLLHSEIQTAFGEDRIHVVHMQKNWRSEERIVDFNNRFFGGIGDLLARNGVEFAGRIAGYYSDVRQQVARKESLGKGYVQVEFLERGSSKSDATPWRDTVLERLPELMRDLLSRYRASDIAFLVRKNEEGAQIAQALLSLGYPVVTEDSLTLVSCLSVRKLAAQLKYRVNPDDPVNATLMTQLFGEIPHLPESCRVSDSLYEICDALLREYLPDIPDGDHPFIFAFLDEVISYTDRYGSNLCGFVNWWDDRGRNVKISSARRDDAVTVMTIHKAKGLDFQVVVLPFFNDTFRHSGGEPPMIWCTPRKAPFDTIGLVPLSATKTEMEGTLFEPDYQEEKEMAAVDAINTAYVAMTRAVKEMYIFSPVPEITNNDTFNGRSFAVSDLLYSHLIAEDGVMGEAFLHREGVPGRSDSRQAAAEGAIAPLRFSSIPYDGRLRLSLKGGEFFSREEGIRYHDILSRIDRVEDLKQAVDEAVREGILAAAEAPEAESKIAALLDSVAGRHWFDGTYRALNEITIVDASGEIHRPDRVLVEKDKPLGQGTALVIDYKFGRREEKYSRQIRRYMKLLSQMGYRDVRGTLWYCNEKPEDVQ